MPQSKTRGLSRARAEIERRTDVVFKALADPTRREILALLAERERAVGEIASKFRTSRPAISKHIRLLREAGLLNDERRGTSRLCKLEADELRHVDAWLETYKTFWTHGLARLKAHVENDR